MTDNIVDRIDALVDEQLAGGEPRTGYDFGDPKFPRCWPCGRHWHGLPITERIAAMYAAGRFDEDYRVDTDDSRVLCRGSDFIGPMPALAVSTYVDQIARVRLSAGSGAPTWLQGLLDATTEFLGDVLGFPFVDGQRRWWRLTMPRSAWDGEASVQRMRITNTMVTFDCLAQSPPTEPAGTWEPLTAPGVTDHPDDGNERGLIQTGPNPWDFEFHPYEGMQLAVERNGQIEVATVTHVDENRETGEIALTCEPRPGFGLRAGAAFLPAQLEQWTAGDDS